MVMHVWFSAHVKIARTECVDLHRKEGKEHMQVG